MISDRRTVGNFIVENYLITTHSGKISNNHDLSFLSDYELKELNTIGYTGRNNNGIRTSREEFLNSLRKGIFTISQYKYDDGDFTEKFAIVRILDKN